MGAPCGCQLAGDWFGEACADLDLVAGRCKRCGHVGACHKLTEDDGRPILWYSGSYEYISCQIHAPRPAARPRWRRMSAAIYSALAAAIGAPVECETCRAIARRKAAADASADAAEATRNALHQLVGAPPRTIVCGRCGNTTPGHREGATEYCTSCGGVIGPAFTTEG